MKVSDVLKELKKVSSEERVVDALRFFKCGKGEYGEGDLFLGVRVPVCRKIALQFSGMQLFDIEKLLQSKWHEARLVALFILILQFKKGNETEQKKIFDMYCKNTVYINNWDLVDCSAYHIFGPFLEHKKKEIFYKYAVSKNMWERRIAIVATFYFIKKNNFTETLRITKVLLKDREDLIHKACGWMLREVGKKDKEVLEIFLKKHIKKIPRTTLRYAIEKFSQENRKKYLAL